MLRLGVLIGLAKIAEVDSLWPLRFGRAAAHLGVWCLVFGV